jgi:hypothetical protein
MRASGRGAGAGQGRLVGSSMDEPQHRSDLGTTEGNPVALRREDCRMGSVSTGG